MEYGDKKMTKNGFDKVEFEKDYSERINKRAIELLTKPGITCYVLFALKENEDGIKIPFFLLSQNFEVDKTFADEFMTLMAKRAKTSSEIRNLKEQWKNETKTKLE